MNTTQFTTHQDTADGEPSLRPELKRLRTQVRRATEEIARLDAENRALRQRVHALEQRPQVSEGEAFVTLDDPEALRTQIEGFISAIDAYLGDQSPSSDEPDQ
jgi:septal ring factor EnvC (AmiA/AmiB activator)